MERTETITSQAAGASPSPHGAALAASPFVASCVGARHPTLQGRVRLRWDSPGGAVAERWVPALQGLSIREGDRVLVIEPSNSPEPVVVGVIDGFARRPDAPVTEAARLEMQPDESVRITSAGGEPLVELRQSKEGPVVRLLDEDADIEVPGRLRFKARQIELVAERGGVDIRAEDDVVVRGETIHLNP